MVGKGKHKHNKGKWHFITISIKVVSQCESIRMNIS